MASEWFYQVTGKQSGPVSGVELRNLAQAGTVTIETPVANAPNGPWVPAGRVKGLFAVPNGAPPPAAATGTTQIPPPHAAASEESSGLGTATKIMLGVCGGVCILVVGLLVWFIVGRDTWELDNASRVSAKLDEAARLQQSDPLAAYKTYDELLQEAKPHKITDERFAQQLADAEKSRMALYPKVQEKIQVEEAEKRRLAEEKARRAAEEKQRIAEEENRKKAALESQKVAEEKRRAEEKRLKKVVAAYSNSPQSARNALNAVKKVEARTEVGINYKDYSTVVGEAWAEVKLFAESPEGKKLPAFSFLLVSAMGKYKLTLAVLQEDEKRVQRHHNFTEVRLISNSLLQQCWGAAHRRIDMADLLLTTEDVAAALSRVLRLEKTDANYEATVRSVHEGLIALTSQISDRITADILASKDPAIAHPEEANKAKELSQKLNDIDKEDKQGP
jgi:hypothetical protein